MAAQSKEFLNEPSLEISYKRLQPFLNNKSFKYSLNFLNNNYNLSEGSKISLKAFKKIFLDIISKFKDDVREDFDDKYKQKGWDKFFNKLKKFFHKVWNRAFSIVCSVTASAVVFTLGFVCLQSLMAAIIACSIYTMITFSIKYFASINSNTNMFYEPGYVGIPKLSSIVDFFKFMYKFIKETIVKVFNWFFYEIEDDNKKDILIRRRRIFLLGVISILVFVLCVF